MRLVQFLCPVRTNESPSRSALVMMLVDEGRLDLDVPIRTYLPDFEVADHHARDTVTPRDLLTHTSGFDGDHFTDTGRGDDALARYVAGCAELPQIAPPGCRDSRVVGRHVYLRFRLALSTENLRHTKACCHLARLRVAH